MNDAKKTTKIMSATQEQWDRIAQLREGAIAAQTDILNHDDVRSTVAAMWRRMGYDAPLTLIAPSPASAVLWAACFRHAHMGPQLGAQLDDQLRDQLRDQLSAQLDAKLRSQLYFQLRDQLSAPLYEQLRDQLYEQLNAQLDDQLRDQLAAGYFSVWWRAWSAWYDGAAILGAHLSRDLATMFRNWTTHVPFCVPYVGLCVTSDNPVAVHWRDGLLHNESGPAVSYADGWSVWSLDGRRVDEQIVMRPETQTIEQINGEQNEEIKRIRIERYGWSRYLADVGAEVIYADTDYDGIHQALMRTAGGMTVLCVACPSSARQYAIEVSPECKTTQQAQHYLLAADVALEGMGLDPKVSSSRIPIAQA